MLLKKPSGGSHKKNDRKDKKGQSTNYGRGERKGRSFSLDALTLKNNTVRIGTVYPGVAICQLKAYKSNSYCQTHTADGHGKKRGG